MVQEQLPDEIAGFVGVELSEAEARKLAEAMAHVKSVVALAAFVRVCIVQAGFNQTIANEYSMRFLHDSLFAEPEDSE